MHYYVVNGGWNFKSTLDKPAAALSIIKPQHTNFSYLVLHTWILYIISKFIVISQLKNYHYSSPCDDDFVNRKYIC